MNILYHPAVLDHHTGDTHPEHRRRIEAFGNLVAERTLPNGKAYLDLVHPKTYIDTVREHCRNEESFDNDTETSAGSFDAAVTAVSLTKLAM